MRNATQFYVHQRPGHIIRMQARLKCLNVAKKMVERYRLNKPLYPHRLFDKYGFVVSACDLAVTLGHDSTAVALLRKQGVLPEPFAVDELVGPLYTTEQARVIVASYLYCLNDNGELDYECYEKQLKNQYNSATFAAVGRFTGRHSEARRVNTCSEHRAKPRDRRRKLH